MQPRAASRHSSEIEFLGLWKVEFVFLWTIDLDASDRSSWDEPNMAGAE